MFGCSLLTVNGERTEAVSYQTGEYIPVAPKDLPAKIHDRELPLASMALVPPQYPAYSSVEKPRTRAFRALKKSKIALSRAQREAERIIRDYARDPFVMRAIAWCESRFDPDAEGPTDDHGLFQITSTTWRDFKCRGNPYNSRENTECANRIFEESGLKRWWASSHCWRNTAKANAKADLAMGSG